MWILKEKFIAYSNRPLGALLCISISQFDRIPQSLKKYYERI